jgi:hypothetical protein
MPNQPANDPTYPINQIIQSLVRIEQMLGRIEDRQIKTTSMVQKIEKEEATQVQGSFGTTEEPQKK